MPRRLHQRRYVHVNSKERLRLIDIERNTEAEVQLYGVISPSHSSALYSPIVSYLPLCVSWSLGRVPADCCYGSASWKDEEAWAAAWLYKATQQVPPRYLPHRVIWSSRRMPPLVIHSGLARSEQIWPVLTLPPLSCAAPQRGYLTHAESVYGVCCTVEAGTNALQNFDWGTKNAGAVLLLYNITGTSTYTKNPSRKRMSRRGRRCVGTILRRKSKQGTVLGENVVGWRQETAVFYQTANPPLQATPRTRRCFAVTWTGGPWAHRSRRPPRDSRGSPHGDPTASQVGQGQRGEGFGDVVPLCVWLGHQPPALLNRVYDCIWLVGL